MQIVNPPTPFVPTLTPSVGPFQYYEMSYGLNVEMHKQVCSVLCAARKPRATAQRPGTSQYLSQTPADGPSIWAPRKHRGAVLFPPPPPTPRLGSPPLPSPCGVPPTEQSCLITMGNERVGRRSKNRSLRSLSSRFLFGGIRSCAAWSIQFTFLARARPFEGRVRVCIYMLALTAV